MKTLFDSLPREDAGIDDRYSVGNFFRGALFAGLFSLPIWAVIGFAAYYFLRGAR